MGGEGGVAGPGAYIYIYIHIHVYNIILYDIGLSENWLSPIPMDCHHVPY